MDFYLNIATITKAINDYNNKHQILSEQKDYVVSSVNWLVGIGWSGEAKDKFLEVFQEKMKLYDKLLEDIQYMINALEEEKQRALMLKMRCEDFVNCIERTGQGGSITGDDEGILSLDYSSQSPINNYINNCTNEDYVNLNKNFTEINDILGELEYTSFGISGEVDSLETSVKDQTESLTEFADSFNVYYAGVKDMESNICSVFSKISGVSGGVFKNSSIISPSGDIDKNQLKDVLLKNEGDLTAEEKASLDYLEKVLGDDEYDEVKEIMTKDTEDLTDAEKQTLNDINNIYTTNENDLDKVNKADIDNKSDIDKVNETDNENIFIRAEEMQENADQITQEGISEIPSATSQAANSAWNNLIWAEQLQENADQMTQEGISELNNKVEWKYNGMEDYVYGTEDSDVNVAVKGNAVDAKAEGKICMVDDNKIDPQIKLEAEATATALNVEAKADAGDKKLGAGVEAKGNLLKGDADVALKVGKDELSGKLNACVQGKAIASVADGSIEGKVKICGIEVDIEATGYAGAAGVDFEGGIVENKFKLGAKAAALLGAGVSVSIGLAD